MVARPAVQRQSRVTPDSTHVPAVLVCRESALGFEKGVEHPCSELSLVGTLFSGQLRGHERVLDIQGQHNRGAVTEALGRHVDAVEGRRL